MSNISIILNQELKIPVSEDMIGSLVLDFSFDNFSQNPTPIETLKPVFRCTNDEYDAVKYIDNWIKKQGIYVGIPTTIQDNGTGITFIDGILNLASPDNEFSIKDGVYKIELKETRQSFFKLLEGLNLRALYENPNIPISSQFQSSDFKSVRYVLSDVPNVGQAVSTSIILFIIARELVNLVDKMYELGQKLGEALPNFTATFGLAGLGALLLIIAEMIFWSLYFVNLVLLAMQLLREISDDLFPKQKGYLCTPVKVILEKVCKSLGYKFSSTLFDHSFKNLNILPATSVEGSLYYRGFNNPIPNKTALEFFNDISLFFNAKFRVTDSKEVIFENKFTFINQPINFSLKDLKNSGNYSYNLSELPKSLRIEFLKDPIESNTNIGATFFGKSSISTESDGSKIFGDSLVVNYAINGNLDSLLTNEINIKIPFARAVRKNESSKFEERLTRIYKLLTDIGGMTLQMYTSFLNIVTLRSQENTVKQDPSPIGFMLLSGDYVGVDKLFILEDDSPKLSGNNITVVNTNVLYTHFYEQESPAYNQWQTIKGRAKEPIINPEDVVNIKNNNNVYDSTGRPILIEENKMDAFTGLHEITYRRKMNGSDVGFVPLNIISTYKSYE